MDLALYDQLAGELEEEARAIRMGRLDEDQDGGGKLFSRSATRRRIRFWAAVYRRERSDGRIQSRLTIEVPWELEPAEVRQLVAGFMRRFDELELPYYAVVHR